MTAYYNEIDPYAAQWLRNLISAGHIAPGDVDERSIVDVSPDDLRGYTQHHFFAGIGVWSFSLRNAGRPDDRPVWTGSCPCQPFSAAGKKSGFDDERHLWPYWHHLVRVCRPAHVFGEQVASKDGLGWFDLVQADLEGEDYAVWPVDMCAAGVGAPHIRQRLWFVAESLEHPKGDGRLERRAEPDRGGAVSRRPSLGLGDNDDAGLEGHTGHVDAETRRTIEVGSATSPGGYSGLAHADGRDTRPERQQSCGEYRQQSQDSSTLALADTGGRQFSQPLGRSEGRDGHGSACSDDPRSAGRPGPTNGLWRDADWLFCRDGKWRPVRPGTFPLAHGATDRVGRLRAYGNAIVSEAAKTIVQTYLDSEHFRLTEMSEITNDKDIFA